MKKEKVVRTSMYAAVLIFLILFLVFSVLAAVTFGNADLSLKDVYSVILYKLFHIKSLAAYGEGAIHDVVWLIRLPRVLLALAIGMALSVCGVVMQAIVQNPLADPYVLGISSGASLGATLAIMLGIGSFLGGNSVGICAFMGAMLTSFAVIAIANMGGKATSAKLILAGMAISAVCSAFSNFVIYITNDKNAATEVMKWNMGSLAGASWARVSAMMPVTLVCVLLFLTQYRSLNLMLLGDEVSITLGTDTAQIKNSISGGSFCNDRICGILCRSYRFCWTCDPSCCADPFRNRSQPPHSTWRTSWSLLSDLVRCGMPRDPEKF